MSHENDKPAPDSPRFAVLLADAERAHAAAIGCGRAADLAADAAGKVYGEAPTPEHAAAWRDAKDARDLCGFVTDAAARKVADARETLAAVQVADARKLLAWAMPRADRAALLARLAPAIMTIGLADARPRVDPLDATRDDAAIIADLDAQHVRDTRRALAARTVRRAIVEQNDAAALALALARDLGEACAARAVPEEHVFSAAALETYAASHASDPAVDHGWFGRWAETYGGPIIGEIGAREARKIIGHTVAASVAWGREVVRSAPASVEGFRIAAAVVLDASRTPEEREAARRAEREEVERARAHRASA